MTPADLLPIARNVWQNSDRDFRAACSSLDRQLRQLPEFEESVLPLLVSCAVRRLVQLGRQDRRVAGTTIQETKGEADMSEPTNNTNAAAAGIDFDIIGAETEKLVRDLLRQAGVSDKSVNGKAIRARVEKKVRESLAKMPQQQGGGTAGACK
jgi:hypothetical protein